ncbi:MAG: gliding motility-associated C-terminal domain-containing protein [Crocinitomicaceae bacterium]|jgi:gliding motility-associated-like protein|nr:gliding motility-associated C-terminal domain-containing protein [Crocinitomicaceae bacterium]
MKRFLLILLSLFIAHSVIFAQSRLANVNVSTTWRKTDFQCGTDGLFTNPDPRYNLTAQTLSGGVGSGFSGPGVFIFDNESCSGLGAGSGRDFSHTILDVQGICADEVQINFQWWEEDACGSDTQFNTGCINDDENNFLFNPIRALTSMSEGVNNNYSHSGGGFIVEYTIFWQRVAVPSLDAVSVTSVCDGSSASLIANTSQTIAGADFYWWDNSLGTGAPVGTGSTFTPTVTGLTSYWVGYADAAFCRTDLLQVDVTVLPAPVPTAAGVSTCVGTAATLSAFEATAVDYTWYSDPAGTILIGTGTSFTTGSLSADSTFYVAANHSNGCESALVPILVTTLGLSVDPTAINAAPTASICPGGGPVNLSVLGGSLGAGADWEWYSGTCGGTSSGSGLSISVSPAVTTTYYARAEGTCDTTNCESLTVVVESLSTAASGIAANDSSVCPGDAVNLSVVGGVLGTSSDWQWYGSACGLIPLGSGFSVVVNPVVTSTYYLRAEGNCDTSSCVSLTINVENIAAAADSATVTIDNICPGDTSQLVAHSAAVLGAGYTWVWYTGACGAVPVGIGDTLDVMPTATTTYYLRAVGTCGFSNCETATLTVLPGSIAPIGVTTDNNNFCEGDSAALTVVGGTLETGAQWTWYENSCGGTPIATGSSVTVIPSNITTYFVRGEGGACGNTECVSIMISVISLNTILVVPFDTLCENSSSAFNLSGGFPVGGVYSGTGVVGSVFDPAGSGIGTHTVTYTYTDGNGCADSASQDLVVELDNVSPTGIMSTDSVICDSTDLTLYVVGGALAPGADWIWYQNGCGEIQLGTGDSLMVSPGVTTTYYARAEGGVCGPSECVSFTVILSEVSAMLIPFEDICEGTIINLENGFPNGGTYSGSGVSGGTFNPAIAGLGVHTISYLYTDNYGCSDLATANVTVSSNPLTASAEISSEPCAEGGVTITVSPLGGTGFYNYFWSDGTFENPYHYAPIGTYSVIVSDGTNCSVQLSNIEISDELGCVEVPNSFTPNGDGMNDTWNLNFNGYNDVSLQVYSKWGKLVFETKSPTIQWDGQYGGDDLPSGTYYYVLKLDDSVDQNGPLTIVR